VYHVEIEGMEARFQLIGLHQETTTGVLMGGAMATSLEEVDSFSNGKVLCCL
jgi:hypothetical protein